MKALPHNYTVSAHYKSAGEMLVEGRDTPAIHCAAPPEFGGSGGEWSPETLLAAAVAGCFTLTFESLARASGLIWKTLDCEVDGELNKVERVLRFTKFDLQAELQISSQGDAETAMKLMQDAERACLISNSLAAPFHLHPTVRVEDRTDNLGVNPIESRA